MSLTGSQLWKSANLVDGTTAISATGASTGVALSFVSEALVIVDCTAVAASGVLNPIVVQVAPDGATYATATGGTLATISAAGRQVVRITGLGGPLTKVRLSYTLASGTSVTLVAEVIGFRPEDSTLADQI